MILSVSTIEGELYEAALEPGRGDGMTLVVDGFPQVLELRGLTGIELTGGSHPVLTLIWDPVRRPYACWPESILHVGTHDPDAPVGTNAQRSRSFVVSDVLSVSVDPTRITVAS